MIKFLISYCLFLLIAFQSFAANNLLLFDTVICKGSRIKLTSPRIGGFTYNWSTGATTESIEVAPAIETQYIVESKSATVTFSDTFNVVVDIPLPKPQITFSSDKILSTYSPTMKIRWVRNNIILPGPANDTLKFPLQGVYRSEVSNLGACWSSSQLLYLAQDTDTAKINFNSTVFPNPNTGSFNLLMTLPRKVTKQIEVVVQDINGAQILKLKTVLIQQSFVKLPIRLPAGFRGQCLLTINLNGISTTEQVIVQ